jgi:hypothetical protein
VKHAETIDEEALGQQQGLCRNLPLTDRLAESHGHASSHRETGDEVTQLRERQLPIRMLKHQPIGLGIYQPDDAAIPRRLFTVALARSKTLGAVFDRSWRERGYTGSKVVKRETAHHCHGDSRSINSALPFYRASGRSVETERGIPAFRQTYCGTRSAV